jgi:hypothetical protein
MKRLACALPWCLAACAALAAPAPPEPKDVPWETGWDKPVDPDGDCKFVREKGVLTIEVPGADHDLGVERGLMNSPRLLRDAEGDFTAQVKVGGAFRPTTASTTTRRIPFVGAGLVLMNGDKTYVRLERATLYKGQEYKSYANWELRLDGQWVQAGEESVQPLEDKPAYLRLERKGDRLRAWVSPDGEKWSELPPLDVKLPAKVKIGVAAGTTSAEPFKPTYEGFSLTAGGELQRQKPD